MSIYNISYDQKAVELLPPDKRTPIQLAWVKAMFGQIKYLRDTTFNYYKKGLSFYEDYNGYAMVFWEQNGTYGLGQLVVYGEAVYKSLKDNNTSLPTSSDYLYIQNTFIGVDDRIMFNANKLVLEYALNERFVGIFRQPPSTSDIYIVKNSLPIEPFIIGYDENESSIVYKNNSNDKMINNYSFGTFKNFTIYVKNSVYSSIGANADFQIRNFVDKYNTLGTTYDIQTW